MINVSLIPILSDNYAFLLQADNGETALVDPGESEAVITYLEGRGIKPDMILITHHHWDHVDGLSDLLAWHECPIYASAREKSRIETPIARILNEGDEFSFGGERVEIIATPGHTREHICFCFRDSKILLAGDTLFVMGCGRLIDGSAEELYGSLQKLAALPDDTKVYCGHEYTLSNAKFCAHIAPEDEAVLSRLTIVESMRNEGLPTIPSTIGEEKQTNVFLKAKSAAEFATLRQRKDQF